MGCASLPLDLKRLELYELDIALDVRLHLPAFVILDLQYATIDRHLPGSYQAVFNPTGLPILKNDTISCSRIAVSARVRADRHPALSALAPQLETLVVHHHYK